MLPLESRQLLSSGLTATFLQPYVEGRGSSRTFAIYYSGGAFDVTTLGSDDVVVNGPNGFRADATFIGLVPDKRDPGIVAKYRVTGIKGGGYEVQVEGGAVADTAGAALTQATIGGFRVGRHGRTTPRGPANPAFNAAVGTSYGAHGSPPPIDTSFGPVLQAINFGGGDADLVGSNGQTIHFDGRVTGATTTPATLQTSPFTVVLNSQGGNDLFSTSVGPNPIYDTEIFSGSQTTEFLTLSGLDPAKRYQFHFLHGDNRLGAVPYIETTQTFTLSTGQTLATPLSFNTSANNETSDTTVDVTGTTSLTYTMPYGQHRGPSFSGMVIEGDATPPPPLPSAQLVASTPRPSAKTTTFDVVYYDPAGIVKSLLGRDEVLVTDSTGATVPATLLSTIDLRHGQHVVATYQINSPVRGASYNISLRRGRVTARTGAAVASEPLGTIALDSRGYAYALIT